MSDGNLKDEYMDASSNVRHFQTIRFAQLTIFVALTGGILNILFGRSEPLPGHSGVVIKLGGFLISVLYMVLHERTMLYWRHFVHRCAELEEQLGYNQYRSRPPAGFLSGTNTMRMFYIVVTLFWLAALVVFP